MTSFLKQAREWATPTLKTSAFLGRGVLTPEEFVAAGTTRMSLLCDRDVLDISIKYRLSLRIQIFNVHT